MSDSQPWKREGWVNPWKHPHLFHFGDMVAIDDDEHATYLNFEAYDAGYQDIRFVVEKTQETDEGYTTEQMESAPMDWQHVQMLRDLFTDWLVKIGKEPE